MEINNSFLCPSCSFKVDNTMNFCDKCGNALKQTDESHKKFITKSIVFYLSFIGFLVFYYFFQPEYNTLTSEIILNSVFIVFVLFFCFLDLKKIIPLFSLKQIPIIVYVLTFLFPIFSTIIVFISIGWLNQSLGFENENLFSSYAYFSTPYIWAFLFTALVPAIFEELAFRGYLFNQLIQILTPKNTIIVSSFLFALMHLSVLSLIWILPFGIILGFLRLKYNTLWLGIAIHFIHNSLMLIIDIAYPDLLNNII